MDDSFTSRIYSLVRRIPEGQVATYGQLARLAGHPGAARAVGNALHHNPYDDPHEIPCYRVVNSQGVLSGAYAFGGPTVQRDLLRADDVEVKNFRVDLDRFLWNGEDE